ALCTRHADVEEPSLLVDLLVGPRELRRELLVVDAREEYRVELEALRAVVGQQVDPARAGSARIEPPHEVVDEVRAGARAVVEHLCEADEPREVGLAHELALAKALREHWQPPGLLRETAN